MSLCLLSSLVCFVHKDPLGSKCCTEEPRGEF